MDSVFGLLAASLSTIGALLMALANWPGYLKEEEHRTYAVLMVTGIFLVFGGFMVYAGGWLHRAYGVQGLQQLGYVILANIVVAAVMTAVMKKRKAH